MGTRLGPYEILAPIGAAGMGEVYRARDTRLGRTAAIKALPSEVARDADADADACARTRGGGDIHAQPSNICTLFDVGHLDGVAFLVLE
jgi:eukaryotic-like serine/threonine-protein kinase